MPDYHQLSHLEKIAVQATLYAGQVLMKHFGKNLDIKEKQGAGIVTNADVEAEAVTIEFLQKEMPSFSILTEETGKHSARAETEGRWILDPLDGTTNFAHGFPYFCVSLAAELHGELTVGVIYSPLWNDLYHCIKGDGAYLNNQPLRVSKTNQLKNALLTTGFSDSGVLQNEIDNFSRLSGRTRAIRRPGSAAMDLAHTARGIFDGFWESDLKPWDVAAGGLLVQEAGGIATQLDGSAFDPDRGQIIASNGTLHSHLLQHIQP